MTVKSTCVANEVEWVVLCLLGFHPPPQLKRNFFFTFVSRQDVRPTKKNGLRQITPEFHEPMNFLSILIKFLITYIQHVTILNNLQQINKMPIQSDQWTPPPPPSTRYSLFFSFNKIIVCSFR